MIHAYEGPAAYPPKELSRPFAGPSHANFGYGRRPKGAITLTPSNCPGARIPRLIIAKDLPGNITVRRTSDSKNPGKAANPSPGRSGMPAPRGLFIGVLGVGPVFCKIVNFTILRLNDSPKSPRFAGLTSGEAFQHAGYCPRYPLPNFMGEGNDKMEVLT